MQDLLKRLKALPQGRYRTVRQAGIPRDHFVSAHQDGLVITNNDSTHPVACTARPLEGCLGIAAENDSNTDLCVAHASDEWSWGDWLLDVVEIMRKGGSTGQLGIHLIGCVYEGNQKHIADKQITDLLKAIKQLKQVDVRTFDIGEKPHPATFAIARGKRGAAYLIRGTADIATVADFERLTGNMYGTDDATASKAFLRNHSLTGVFQPEGEYMSTYIDAEYWDGRLPEHQKQKVLAR